MGVPKVAPPGGCMDGITLSMVVRNEARNLKKILKGCHKLFDKILVMDQDSDDETAEIVKSFGGEVIPTTRKDLADIDRQSLYELVDTEWLCVLDGDEMPSKELKKFLKSHRQKPDPKVDVYWIRFKNLIDGVDMKPILGDDWHPRLWRTRINGRPAILWPKRAHTWPKIISPRQLWLDTGYIIHDRSWRRVKKVHEKRMGVVDPEMRQVEANFLNAVSELLKRSGQNGS